MIGHKVVLTDHLYPVIKHFYLNASFKGGKKNPKTNKDLMDGLINMKNYIHLISTLKVMKNFPEMKSSNPTAILHSKGEKKKI